MKSSNIEDLRKLYLSYGTYTGVPANILVAFDNGDIGYFLFANAPRKRSKVPFHGCYVIDGTTSEYDWVGYKELKELPYVVNPKKGYLITANNRQYTDNIKDDFGAAHVSTPRAQRIEELILNGIRQQHKFDVNDMKLIQQDQVDVVGREAVINLVKLGYS